MAKNRGDLLTKLTDALVEIGVMLGRIEMALKMYPTNRMMELSSMLYAAVVDFLEEMILLFQRSAVRMSTHFQCHCGYLKTDLVRSNVLFHDAAL